jgi:hypothetical protein
MQQEFPMKKIFGLAFALTTALSTAALAAPQHERIRGTVSSISPTTLVVQTASGADVSVTLTGKTHFLQVTNADLTHIPAGSFIGTATKSVGSLNVALEVVVFPPAMAGTGEGHYAWDKITDTTRAGGGSTNSSMTNGTVSAVSAPATVNSSMTNGTVTAATPKNGVQKLTVTYKGGQQTIIVPPTAPIVTFHPGTMAVVTTGAPVFVNAMVNGNTATAAVVAVGVNGVRPPM